jgi:hypothetical protein
MSCITQLMALKGDKEFLPVHDSIVIEGGGLYKDHEYLIVFTTAGYRCGYVALKHEEHLKLSEEGQEYPSEPKCHGGITLYENTHVAKRLLPMPCEDFWIGFDAAHWYDSPDPVAALKYFGENTESVRRKNWSESLACFDAVKHRTFEYMESECFSIIDQLDSWNLNKVPA